VITFVWIKLDVAIGAGKKGKGSAVVTFEAGNEPIPLVSVFWLVSDGATR
jgi:hypothetical protein